MRNLGSTLHAQAKKQVRHVAQNKKLQHFYNSNKCISMSTRQDLTTNGILKNSQTLKAWLRESAVQQMNHQCLFSCWIKPALWRKVNLLV